MRVAGPGVPSAVSRAAAALGRGAPAEIRRLQGGTCKGVYRARWSDGRTMIVYRWHPDEDQWGDRGAQEDAGASGWRAFLEAHRLLTSIGVRVPALHHEGVGDDGDDATAVVEDAGDRTLEHVLAQPAGERDRCLVAFDGLLRTLHAQQRDTPGNLDRAGERSSTPSRFPDQILERARQHLDESRSHPAIRSIASLLGGMLTAAHDRVQPRTGATLIHGELGPDHVIVTSDGQPCLIDVEGLSYADLEWEHAYLAMRFGSNYEALRRDHLDDARFDLYTLAHHLSLVAGPSFLLSRNGADPVMQGIVAHHSRRLVELASAAG